MTSLSAARAFVVDSLAPSVAGDRHHEVELVASELITNAILHGDGVTLDVTVDVGPDAVAVGVSSTSTSDSVPPPEQWVAPVDPLAPSGRGLFLVTSICDDVHVTRQGRHLTVTGRFRRPNSESTAD